jgi:hypothetical protein
MYSKGNNLPHPISEDEYREILTVPEIKDAWGISDDEQVAVSPYFYAVKFNYLSGSPGYVGPLYLVYGDAVTGHPFVLVREDDKLVAAAA